MKGFVEPAGSRLSFIGIVLYESEVVIQFVTDSGRLIICTSRDCVIL